jgi:phosphate starvation-inducible protein PhoH
MVITGDLEQSDIKNTNGLDDAIQRLRGLEEIAIVSMTEASIVRDPIVAAIERRYKNTS